MTNAAFARKPMDDTMKQNKGFTVVELMAIVAIISILAVLALSAYQDYVVRSKVGEGLVFAAEAKTSVSEYYSTNRALPADNAAAGLPSVLQYEANSYNHIHFLQITVTPAPGTIAVKFKIPGTTADNKVLILVPDTADDSVTWTCEPAAVDGIDNKFVPANCRG
jgi:type IV pilus assembly protein PilA